MKYGFKRKSYRKLLELAAGSSCLKSIIVLFLVRDFAGLLKYLQSNVERST